MFDRRFFKAGKCKIETRYTIRARSPTRIMRAPKDDSAVLVDAWEDVFRLEWDDRSNTGSILSNSLHTHLCLVVVT